MTLKDSSVARARSAVKRAADTMERDGKIDVEVDQRNLDQSLDKAERSVGTSARSMTSTFARVFTGAAVVAGLKGAITAASNLGESMNAVNVTFGEAASGVHALGEESAQSLGLSTEAFNALAVRFSSFASTIAGPGGDVAKTLDDLTTRAADFASVMNIDVAQAAELFQSGLAGETEPLRQYGIDLSAAAVEAHAMSVGIGDGTRALTEAEKVQARYSLLLQQTSQVQGDFANTSDSAANRQRILAAEFENAKAKLGESLLPVFSQAVGVLTQLVEVFTSLPGPVQTGIVAMLGIVAVAGPVKDATQAFGGLEKITTKLGKAGGPLLALTVAVGAAALVYNAMGREQRELNARTEEVAEALGDQTAAVLDLAAATTPAIAGIDGLAVANSALGQALINTGEDGQKIREAFGTLGLEISHVVDWMDALQGNEIVRGDTFAAMAQGAGVASEYVNILAETIEQTDHNGAELQSLLALNLQKALGISSEAAAELAEELMPVAEAMEELDDQSQKFDGNAITRDFLQLAAGSNDVANGLITMAEAQSGLSRNGEHTRSVMAQLIEIVEALPPEAEAAARAALGLDGANTELADSAEAAADALGEAAGKGGELVIELDKAGTAVEKFIPKIVGHITAVKEAGDELGFFAADAKEAGDQSEVLGDAIEDAAEAAADAGPDFDALRDATSQATQAFDELDDAANRLRAAIDRVTGPQDDLRETTAAVYEEFENLNAGLAENGTDYSVATAAGRANQRQLEETRDAILAHGVALVRNGQSAEEATGDIEYNIEALKNQWREAGLTEEAIAALIEQYNLTPEDIETTLRLEGEAAAQAAIDRYQALLDDIDTEKVTTIRAAIAAGDIASVRAELDAIENEVRSVYIGVRGPGANRSRDLAGSIDRAAGGYVGAPEFGWTGEAGPEAVLPLTRPSRIRELLADPRIADPIADAMGDAGGIGGGLTINGGISVGSASDIPLVADALEDIMFKAGVS